MAKFKGLRIMSGAVLLSGVLAGCALLTDSPKDADITRNVETQLRQHPELGSPNDITVTTHDQVVYLSGLVVIPPANDEAEAVARKVPGVERVSSTVAVEQ